MIGQQGIERSDSGWRLQRRRDGQQWRCGCRVVASQRAKWAAEQRMRAVNAGAEMEWMKGNGSSIADRGGRGPAVSDRGERGDKCVVIGGREESNKKK